MGVSTNDAVLEARDLHKTYEGEGHTVAALRGIDLAIGRGQFVAVMGPSGCGKSTLLHLLGALDRPSAGDVLLDGQPLAERTDRELTEVRRHRVGFVFQFFNLVPVLTAAENAGLPLVIDGRPEAEQHERVTEILALVGIADVADQLPSQLSGGQQQRVAVARALVNKPSVILADEPTGNLDYRGGRDLMELFRRLHADGQSLVVVTHDPGIAAFAERVVFLRDGKVVDDVPVDERGAEALLARLVALEQPN
ncbi:MAG: ABC transporter ATP-binding protein [Actinobacteria bacterium]|nr:ABC transporter ATP-binding protein [Actinomycetota bacterium]